MPSLTKPGNTARDKSQGLSPVENMEKLFHFAIKGKTMITSLDAPPVSRARDEGLALFNLLINILPCLTYCFYRAWVELRGHVWEGEEL